MAVGCRTLIAGLAVWAGWMAGLPALAADPPSTAVEVFERPSESGFSNRRIPWTELEVIGPATGDWLRIRPPVGTFDWIAEDALEDGIGRTRTVRRRAVLRGGRPGAALPGTPVGDVEPGTDVETLDLPPLELDQVSGPVRWIAIRPTTGESRFIRGSDAKSLASRFDEDVSPIVRAAVRTAPTSRSIAPDLAALDLRHRAVLQGSWETWDLDSIRQDYLRYLERTADGEEAAQVRARLAAVDREERIARAARSFDEALKTSRRIDTKTNLSTDSQDAPPARRSEYDATGLLQPSSRLYQGQKVYALVGPQGGPIAYLALPLGLDLDSLLAHRVGVRGAIRFDDVLQARLILVSDIEALDRRP